jgi:signal transduction histidine kinase
MFLQHPLSWIGSWRLGTKLIFMVFGLMASTLAVLVFTYSHYERILLDDVQSQNEALSKIIEIGIQQLTSKGQTDQQFLEDYVKRLSEKGVGEVSILTSERTIVASSEPTKVGKTVKAKEESRPLVITGTLGEDDAGKRATQLEIPIIVDDVKLGYLRLRLVHEDLATLIRKIALRRALAASLVFVVAAGGVLVFSWRMTKPLSRLASAAAQVGEGNLESLIPVTGNDEIARLQASFNDMVLRLRKQRRLESALRRAERAASLGRIASAVAHEIRNPLNYINLSVDHLRVAHQPVDGAQRREFEESVDAIKTELQRVNALVSDFLNYGRPRPLKLQELPVGELLAELGRFAAPRAAAQQIRMSVEIGRNLPPVRADAEALRICALNLVTNALQSIGQGGNLSLVAESPDPAIVRIRVRDDGPGIPPANLERVFEPWFSTKEAGVGLGLAITQRFVEEHGGAIRVRSRPGETEFEIDLPTTGPIEYTESGRIASQGSPSA